MTTPHGGKVNARSGVSPGFYLSTAAR